MDPNSSEPIEALIARRPHRLNILITARAGETGSRPAAHGVILRYGHTPVSDTGGRVGGRRTKFAVRMLPREDYDAEAINAGGTQGAWRDVPDAQGIRAAVLALRQAWGHLHVQDNSGLVPDLHDGMWRG